MYVVGCYAAWNNNYSGQEEATLCIVKCLKEHRKLVFQMRNKVFNNVTMSYVKVKQQKSTWIYIQKPSIPGQKESLTY